MQGSFLAQLTRKVPLGQFLASMGLRLRCSTAPFAGRDFADAGTDGPAFEQSAPTASSGLGCSAQVRRLPRFHLSRRVRWS